MVYPIDIEVTTSDEKWNKYKLKDGTILKIKLVLVRVIMENEDPQGHPIFGFQTSNVIGVIPPTKLIENKPIDRLEDIGFESLNDEWNTYELANDFILQLKPAITQVNRTGIRDQKLVPMYDVQAQVLVKLKPNVE
jgi:hypothetical protein